MVDRLKALGAMDSLYECMKERAAQTQTLKDRLKDDINVVPLTDAVLHMLNSVGQCHQEDIMRCHPGYVLERKLRSLQNGLDTYRQCHADLIDVLSRFDTAATEASLFMRRRAAEFKEYQVSCRKEIFAVSSAAYALINLARRVRCNMKMLEDEFEETRKKTFDDNQNAFIIQLRRHFTRLNFFRSGLVMVDYLCAAQSEQPF